jgi:hypothetical protein
MKLQFVLAIAALACLPAHGKAAAASNTANQQLELSQEIAKVNSLDAQASTPALKNVLEHSVAKAARVPVGTITEQRQKTALGPGDLLVANVLAKESGATFDQIKAEHATRTWADSAAARHVKLSDLISRLKSVETDFEAELKKIADQDRKARDAALRAQQQAEQRHLQQLRQLHRRHR